MDRDGVLAWVERYERAWRDEDLDAVGELFTADARYRPSPYEEPILGLEAIRAFWIDDDGEVFTMTAEPVAVDDPVAVVRVEVHYGDPVRQEYRDLWVMRFTEDGRVEEFEEWAYWPGMAYSAAVPTQEA